MRERVLHFKPVNYGDLSEDVRERVGLLAYYPGMGRWGIWVWSVNQGLGNNVRRQVSFFSFFSIANK